MEATLERIIRNPSRVVALVGPTAVGKTNVSIELAQRLSAEIISCDAMQLYRGMPILTQVPTSAQRKQVVHHLVECVDPTESFNAGRYRSMSVPLINRLLEHGKPLLIVGGTGMYLKVLTEGLCDAPPGDRETREALWRECSGIGSTSMHNRLQELDSTAASRIHPHDARRIIRALEVYALTGKPLSDWWKFSAPQRLQAQVIVIGMNRDRVALYERINQRLIHMIYEEGVINEARRMLRLALSLTARQVHGLGDIERYLRSEVSLKDTVTIWQQRVRNYAKRQLTWFRQTPGIQWVGVPEDERPWQTASRIEERIRHLHAHPVGALESHAHDA